MALVHRSAASSGLLLMLALLTQCAAPSKAFAVHQGCVLAGSLPFVVAETSSMSVEICRALAAARFVPAFGLTEGNRCVLDPDNSNSIYLERFGPGAACTTPCSGAPDMVCGGAGQVSLFYENDPAAPTSPPAHEAAPVGCFKDDPAARRLTLLWESSSMDLARCAHIAFTQRMELFALEAGRACYGGTGDSLETAKALGASGGCTELCAGDSTAYCGGASAFNLLSLTNPPWQQAQPKAITDGGTHSAAASASGQSAGGASGGAAAITAPQSGAASASVVQRALMVMVAVGAAAVGAETLLA